MKTRIKILEARLESGIERLEELRESGIPKSQLHDFYHKELELEEALIDYMLLVCHIQDNKIRHYVERIKYLIKEEDKNERTNKKNC